MIATSGNTLCVHSGRAAVPPTRAIHNAHPSVCQSSPGQFLGKSVWSMLLWFYLCQLCGASASASWAVAAMHVRDSRHASHWCAACCDICRAARWRANAVALRSIVTGKVVTGIVSPCVVATDVVAGLDGTIQGASGTWCRGKMAGGEGQGIAGRGGRNGTWRDGQQAGRDRSLWDVADGTGRGALWGERRGQGKARRKGMGRDVAW